MPGSRASPSISGSSVVPGLPNITETPSCLRSSRNACLPEMYGIGPDDKLSCVSLPDAPLLRAARRAPVPYTPVWLMRQAGRYLPEYRAMRERFGFLELCRNPEAAAEVTLQPVDRLGVDAAILFADILLIVEPLDVGLEFARGEGPLIRRPLRDEAQIRRLAPIDVDAAVQIFDSWVGVLAADDYRTFVQPHTHALIRALTPGAPVIHFGTGTAALLPLMRAAGGDVIALDWRVDLDTAWASLGHDVAVQGNLDPAVPARAPRGGGAPLRADARGPLAARRAHARPGTRARAAPRAERRAAARVRRYAQLAPVPPRDARRHDREGRQARARRHPVAAPE